MPLSRASRWYLSAALGHLSAAGALIVFAGPTGALTANWDALLWLLLIGFVGFATFGFSLHLFPPLSRRVLPKAPLDRIGFVLAEFAVVAGAVAQAGVSSPWTSTSLFALAAGAYLGAVAITVGLFVGVLARPPVGGPRPEVRPGDAVTVPLFVAGWAAALGSGALFVLSGISTGPGFGWWVAAVHLFVLGHATLLILAVTVRLVPRSVDANPPRAVTTALAVLGISGATLVPAGMLLVPASSVRFLAVLGLPEAAFAVLFFAVLLYLGARARTPRRQMGLHLVSVTALLVGGGLGLGMVLREAYDPLIAHALVNVLGFVGITILILWFSMVAPFQRISHAWTQRMLWALAVAWLGATVVLAVVGRSSPPSTGELAAVGGALLLGSALTWGAGTIPVLYPRINPLPGLTSEEIRVLRNRWSGR